MQSWTGLIRPGERLGRRAGLSEESTEDLVQDALLVLVARRDEIADHRAWFLGVLRKLLLKRLRARYQRGAVSTVDAALLAEITADPNATPDERVLDLRRALNGLDPELRRIVVLSELWGLSAAETAAIEGLETEEIYLRKRRAMRAFPSR